NILPEPARSAAALWKSDRIRLRRISAAPTPICRPRRCRALTPFQTRIEAPASRISKAVGVIEAYDDIARVGRRQGRLGGKLDGFAGAQVVARWRGRRRKNFLMARVADGKAQARHCLGPGSAVADFAVHDEDRLASLRDGGNIVEA